MFNSRKEKERLVKEVAEHYVKMEGIQGKIDSLLATEYRPSDDG